MQNDYSSPLEKYTRRYGSVLESFDRRTSNLSATPEGMQQMVLSAQAMMLHNWARDIAIAKRHGFVKKVMEEIR